ncbi:MAG TPA: glycosyltransferase [Thermodesulfovibrionales bacterium]|nr:glycosyltransferase [Thermodesulfovibrionales bacterium]
MNKLVSVIIPNYNSGVNIRRCLEAVYRSDYPEFEVVVVDDCSTDDSVEMIRNFPCRLVRLDRHSGASRARNVGAQSSNGEILFFMDSDCLVRENTLALAARSIEDYSNIVVGGTYTALPADDGFFSTFQSVFINYSETKDERPDYVASHAMVIHRRLFDKSGGFPEDFLPILEDVEFSHRLRRNGCELVMNPGILVRHIFNFTLKRSLKNAFRKAKFWTIYSMGNNDLMSDSGTASRELKINGVSFVASALFLFLFVLSGKGGFLFGLLPVSLLNLLSSSRLIEAFYRTKGFCFACCATIYYMTLYPLAAGTGAVAGALQYGAFAKALSNRTPPFTMPSPSGGEGPISSALLKGVNNGAGDPSGPAGDRFGNSGEV